MSDHEKHEFVSPGWIDEVRRYLETNVVPLGDAISGAKVELCEIYSDAPAHLADADGRAAWWMRIDGPTVDAGSGIPDWWTRRHISDYQETLPLARTVFAENPEVLAGLHAKREQLNREAVARGEEPFPESSDTPPVLAEALSGLHDHVARRTR